MVMNGITRMHLNKPELDQIYSLHTSAFSVNTEHQPNDVPILLVVEFNN